MLGRRTGWWRVALLGAVAGLSLQGCSQGAPSVNLGTWVRSPYVVQLRARTTTTFGTWLSALRGTRLAARVTAVADGCGQYADGSGGGLDPLTDWGVTCGREVVVALTAPGGLRQAQVLIARALTRVGWNHWSGTLAVPSACREGDLRGPRAQALIQPDIGTAVLSEWRLTCARKASGVVRFGPAASGCSTGPMTDWVVWSWHEHECRPTGTVSRETAPDVILIALATTYVGVDEGTSNHTTPPPVTNGLGVPG
jgi:hypothetical protein